MIKKVGIFSSPSGLDDLLDHSLDEGGVLEVEVGEGIHRCFLADGLDPKDGFHLLVGAGILGDVGDEVGVHCGFLSFDCIII